MSEIEHMFYFGLFLSSWKGRSGAISYTEKAAHGAASKIESQRSGSVLERRISKMNAL